MKPAKFEGGRQHMTGSQEYPFKLTLKEVFFKSTIYYTECDGSPCLQEELCMEYQYSNLFIQLLNTKNY